MYNDIFVAHYHSFLLSTLVGSIMPWCTITALNHVHKSVSSCWAVTQVMLILGTNDVGYELWKSNSSLSRNDIPLFILRNVNGKHLQCTQDYAKNCAITTSIKKAHWSKYSLRVDPWVGNMDDSSSSHDPYQQSPLYRLTNEYVFSLDRPIAVLVANFLRFSEGDSHCYSQ